MMDTSEYKGTFLSDKDIIAIHDKIIDESEYNDDKGFLDIDGSLFQSAVYSVFAGFGGQDVYPTVEEKAARLCFNLITGHTFRNANKRTAMMSMLMTLEMNGKNNKFDEEQIYDVINGVGSGEVSYEQLLDFVTSKVDKKYSI